MKCNAYFIGAKPISLGSGSNFNPQNTPCISAVKIFAFLPVFALRLRRTSELEPRLNEKADLTGQAKMSIFQRSLLDLIYRL
jgi:hypothetical protein